MKKIIFIYFLIFILSLILTKEDTLLVSKFDDFEYSKYVLEFPNLNISTNNLHQHFNNIQIIWIEPYINKLHKDINYKKYYFNNDSLIDNINNFKEDYINIFNKYGYKVEAMNFYISGIKIHRMQVYTKEENILKLKINDFKYEKVE